MSLIFPAVNNMVFERNIEGCLVTGIASPAVNSEGCDTSSTCWFDCNFENRKRYACPLVEDCSLDEASTVTVIVAGERRKRGVYRLPIDVEDDCGVW